MKGEGVLWYCNASKQVALVDIIKSVCQSHLKRLGTEAKFICVHPDNPQTQGVVECDGLPILTDLYQQPHHYYATRSVSERQAN